MLHSGSLWCIFAFVSVEARCASIVLEWDGYSVPVISLKRIEELATRGLKSPATARATVVALQLRRGIARYHLRKFAEATLDFEAVLKSDPLHVEVRWRLARLLSRNKDT